MQPSRLPTAGEALMSDSHGSNTSMNVPQAHNALTGRLRGNVAGGPDTSGSSAGMAPMDSEAATDDAMLCH